MADGSLPQPANLLGQTALAYGGTGALPAVQHSQYLADALRAMQANPPTISNRGALVSNLLAEALLRYGQSRSNSQLMNAIGQGSQGQVANAAQNSGWTPPPGMGAATAPPQMGGGILGALHHLFAGGAQPAPQGPAPPMAPQPAPQAPAAAPPPAAGVLGALAANPPPGPGAPAAAAPANPAASPGITPDVMSLVQTVGGEARGEPPAGQAAVAAVALNRAKATGRPLSAVVSAPGQFAGYQWGVQNLQDPTSPAFQHILQNIAPALNGYDPTGGADHFYAPRGMPGGQPPPWAIGKPYTQIGNHHFLSLGPGSPGMPQAVAQNPGAFQVAGPIPPASPGPSSPGPAGGAPPAGLGGPAGGAAPGMAQQPPMPTQAGPPTGPRATPEEQAFISRALSAPQGSVIWQAGLQKLQEVQQRAMTPLAPPKDYRWGANGQPVSELPYQDVQGPPNAFTQRGPDNQLHVTANPAFGSVPAGAQLGPNGLAPIGVNGGTEWSAPMQVPGLAGLQVRNNITGEYKSAGPSAAVNTPIQGGGNGATWSQKPGEAPTLVQGPVTAEMVAQRGSQFNSLPEIAAAREGVGAVRAFDAAVGKINPGGPVDQAAIDAYIRSISSPTAGVRQGPVQVFLEHQNLPDQVKGDLMRVFGQGFLSPATLKQMGQVIWSNSGQRLKTAQGMDQDNRAWAQKAGFDPNALGENLPQMADVPAYSQDDPRTLPAPQMRKPGMTVWSPKGPAVWTGQGWRLQQ